MAKSRYLGDKILKREILDDSALIIGVFLKAYGASHNIIELRVPSPPPGAYNDNVDETKCVRIQVTTCACSITPRSKI